MEDFIQEDLDYINNPFNLSDLLYIQKMSIKWSWYKYTNKTPEEKREYHRKHIKEWRKKKRQERIELAREKQMRKNFNLIK